MKCPQLADSEKSKKLDLREEVLPPCQACKTFVNSFLLGVNVTNKKYLSDDESDSNVAEDSDGSSKRLTEIKRNMCSDVQRGQKQCYTLTEDWEYLIDDWWTEGQKSTDDIFTWLCIKKVEHCCPENHFGADCKACDGYPDAICSNNGKCKGAGTRKGNGECLCNPGYNGHKCNECDTLYYESYRDDDKLLCSKCHFACRISCTTSGPKACKECNPGWLNDPDHGCMDINECASLSPCKNAEFCVNTEGSFSCLKCDPSCDGCHGDGPDMCVKCALGFFLKDGLCTQRDRAENMDWARYFTYLGLCVATCIIFQKNTVIASIIGLCVAIYVSVSEYMLAQL